MQAQNFKHIIIVSTIVFVIASLCATAFVLFLSNQDTVSRIDVSRQRPSDTIMITDASLYKGGFIAIHSYSNQTIGDVVGVSEYLEPGEYQKLRVALKVPPERNMELIAVLYKDDGDGDFDVVADTRVKNAEHGDVVKDFMLQY